MPSVLVASSDGLGACGTVVDSQMECNGAVTGL